MVHLMKFLFYENMSQNEVEQVKMLSLAAMHLIEIEFYKNQNMNILADLVWRVIIYYQWTWLEKIQEKMVAIVLLLF